MTILAGVTWSLPESVLVHTHHDTHLPNTSIIIPPSLPSHDIKVTVLQIKDKWTWFSKNNLSKFKMPFTFRTFWLVGKLSSEILKSHTCVLDSAKIWLFFMKTLRTYKVWLIILLNLVGKKWCVPGQSFFVKYSPVPVGIYTNISTQKAACRP